MEQAFLLERFVLMDELLRTEAQWTQVVGARNIHGKPVNPADPQAICWCLLGAAFKVARLTAHGKAAYDIHHDMMLCLRATLNDMGHAAITVGEYNDDSKFPAIKDLIAKARATLEPGPDAGVGAAAAA